MRKLVLIACVALATGCGSGSGDVPLFFFNGDGTFADPFRVEVDQGNFYNDAILGDFDGNGIPDVATTDVLGDTVSIMLGNGDGTFTPAVPPQVQLASTGSQGVARDFDLNGTVDLVVTAFGAADVYFLAGNGDGTFLAPVSIGGVPAASTPIPVVAGHFDGNETLDLAIGLHGPNAVLIQLGNGNGTFTPAVPPTVVLVGPVGDLAIADFDRDGELDFVATQAFIPAIAVGLGNGDGTFSSSVTSSLNPLAQDGVRLTTADFNRDGMPDVAVATNGFNIAVLLGLGNGELALAPNPPLVAGSFQAIASGDFDTDGTPDLAIGTEAPALLEILFGAGNGDFHLGVPPGFVDTPPVSEIEVADLDRNGTLDLVLRLHMNDDLFVMLGNRR